MKLYHVQPQAYGTFGSAVLAESESRARELFLSISPWSDKFELSVELLTDDVTKEYAQPELME